MMYGEENLLGIFGLSVEKKISSQTGVDVQHVKIILASYRSALDVGKKAWPDSVTAMFIENATGYDSSVVNPVLDRFTGIANAAATAAKNPSLPWYQQARKVLIPVVVLGVSALGIYGLNMVAPFLPKRGRA